MNKRFLLIIILLLNASLIFAQDLNGVKVLINPGHGGLDPANDRNIPETGFWESVGNLSKGLYLRDILQNLGATVIMSRTTNNDADDLPLSTIVAMANNNNVQYMHSIHSNAAGGNYTLMLYRGTDATPEIPASKTMAQLVGQEIISAHRTTDLRVRGDLSFYGTWQLGVLRGLSMPGSLSEGSFHDYIPESWRLRNEAYLKHEAWAIAKAFLAFWGKPALTTGIVAGIFRDLDKSSGYTPINPGDGYKPVNNLKVTLKANDASNTMVPKVYTGDSYNNGFFMFDELKPGSYKVIYEASGYFKDSADVTVLASKNSFADKYLTSNSQAEVVSVAIAPATGDSLYPGNQTIVIDFSRPMNTASVEAAISTTPSAPLTFTWTSDQEVKVNTAGLPFGTALTLTIAGTAQGKAAGILLDGNKDGVGGDGYSFSFKTRSQDVWAPVVESAYPSDKLENVELIPLINISFNEQINTNSVLVDGKVKLVKAAGNVGITAPAKCYNLPNGKAVVSLLPSNPLTPNETYNVIVAAGLKDQYGNATASDIVYTFKTAGQSFTITPIDNFELDLLTNWAAPTANSPSGIIAAENSLVKNLSITSRFAGSRVSMQLNYSWDKNASSWFLSENLIAGTPKNVTFTSQNVLQAYVFGDGSGNKFRYCVADGTNFSGLEVSPWYTIDWSGWKLVNWNMSRDGVGTWAGNTKGNGTLDGQLKFDSFQFTYTPGNPSSGMLFFDDLRAATYPITGVEKESGGVKPSSYALAQNYPNPFNPTTTLSYQLPENSFVSLKVFDLLGREVATLVNEEQTSGKYKVEFNAANIPSGIYIYMLKTNSYKETKKMVLLK